MTISERPSTAPERAAPAPTPERAAPEQASEEAAPRPARPVALITGVGRSIGIGAGIARQLAASGWDVAFTYWTPYDRRMEWGAEDGAAASIARELENAGARTAAIEADLTGPDAPVRIFDEAEQRLGPVTALVLSHAESVDSGLLDTTVAAFDRHFAVNARASWLLIREYGLRFRGGPESGPREPGAGAGRIVALTSDHTVGNLPYGASKGALDRITLAAAHELAHLGVTANVVNPGPVDTGWMNDDLREAITRGTPLGRLGTPQDTAHLVDFLCSPQGQWVNGQLLKSNGGAAP
ncbi:SDR family oxidoreductase [Streptomyces sp. NPDC018055]|uniref:SDR family oxidoreductase n=1 Tax=Streptomyces sp. NPDC018055 TaxID=3365038 RepID=UPI0037A348FD